MNDYTETERERERERERETERKGERYPRAVGENEQVRIIAFASGTRWRAIFRHLANACI